MFRIAWLPMTVSMFTVAEGRIMLPFPIVTPRPSTTDGAHATPYSTCKVATTSRQPDPVLADRKDDLLSLFQSATGESFDPPTTVAPGTGSVPARAASSS